MSWICLASGVFHIFMSLITKTENMSSAILFKLLPFFLGLGTFLVGLKLGGFLL